MIHSGCSRVSVDIKRFSVYTIRFKVEMSTKILGSYKTLSGYSNITSCLVDIIRPEIETLRFSLNILRQIAVEI